MSGVGVRAVTGEVQTGTALKTIAQAVAAANHRVEDFYFTVSFKGVTPTDSPIWVEVLKQTTAGTMSALTGVKDVAADDETLQTTFQHTATAEPTAGDLKYGQYVHPQGGAREIGPFRIPGGERLGLRVTASVDVKCVVAMRGKE